MLDSLAALFEAHAADGVVRMVYDTNVLLQQPDRVGGGLTPPVLPHHRTYGSVSGGSP